MPKTQRFEAEILEGHKGEAVLVPFDPAETWGVEPAAVPKPWAKGYLVKATVAGHPHDGWVGHRWGRFFMLVPPELQRAAHVSAGDVVEVVLTPRKAPALPSRALARPTRKPRSD